jgi:hypothetical protein
MDENMSVTSQPLRSDLSESVAKMLAIFQIASQFPQRRAFITPTCEAIAEADIRKAEIRKALEAMRA